MSANLKFPPPTPKPRKPSRPTHLAATGSVPTPRQAGVASPATVAIDLLCLLSSPTESRSGLGASFFSPGFRDNPRGVTVVLNRANPLVHAALVRGDRSLIAFLVAELFAEFLFFRGRSFPLVQALQSRLAAKIFSDRPPTQFSLLTNFGSQLATSFLANQLPLPLTTNRQLVRSFSFPVDPTLLDLPWATPPKPLRPAQSHNPRQPEPKQKAA